MDGLPVPVNVAVVGVGTDDAAVKTVIEKLGALGHRFLEIQQRTSSDPLLELLSTWLDNPNIDVVLALAADTDPVRAAVAPLVTRSLPGFGELLRIAAFDEIGSAAMTLDAEAARCGSKYVFVIPGAIGAVKVALDRLLIPQLDLRTRPSSLAAKLPRLRAMLPPTDAFNHREHTEPGAGPTPPRPASPSVAPPIATVAEMSAPSPVAAIAETSAPSPVVATAETSVPAPVAAADRSGPARTVPPGPPPRSTKTPPMGVVLRAPAQADSGEIPLLNSDAAIPIQPAVIVDDSAPQIAVPRTNTDEIIADQIVQEAAKTDERSSSEALTSDNVGAFVRSLELHAKEIREKSNVGPLPRRPKTEPPPLPKKTDAELKAARDASVAEAISHVGPAPAKPAAKAAAERVADAPAPAPKPAAERAATAPTPPAEAADEAPAAPPRRSKNVTTRAQWEQAADELAKSATKPAEPTLAELESRDRVIAVKAPKKRRGAIFVPLAIAAAAAGGYVIKTQLAANGTASAEPQHEQLAAVEPPAPPPAATPTPAAEPEIVVNVGGPAHGSDAEPHAGGDAEPQAHAGDLTSLAQAHTHHAGGTATPAPHATGTGEPSSAATGSAAGSAEPADPRTHPNIAPASPDCDEASCILEKYARQCCARYKPAEMPVEKIDPPKPAGPPDTLDKAAVKAGIADVKPAVQQCGEDHYHQGTVKITLTVSADGAVTDATVADSPDPELGKCVASALRRATFGKTQNGAVFTYPFAF